MSNPTPQGAEVLAAMSSAPLALSNAGVWAITVGAIVFIAILGFIAVIRITAKNRRTRFGFFIEHELHKSDEDLQDTKVTWPEKPKDGM